MNILIYYLKCLNICCKNLDFLNTQYDPEYVVTFKTDKITIESEQDVKWTLDGEDGGIMQKVDIHCLQRRVQILSPK